LLAREHHLLSADKILAVCQGQLHFYKLPADRKPAVFATRLQRLGEAQKEAAIKQADLEDCGGFDFYQEVPGFVRQIPTTATELALKSDLGIEVLQQ
jgi:hypothetical protein